MAYKIDPNKINDEILSKTVNSLKRGNIIVYPTDTAYALGCDAANNQAVKKVFNIKQRLNGKPLPVIVYDLEMASLYCLLNKKENELANEYWPEKIKNYKIKNKKLGKLSLVLKAVNNKSDKMIAKNVMAKDGTVAVRAPFSLWARQLALKLGAPLVSTSANLSGNAACYSIAEIKKSFKEHPESMRLIDIILDAGKLSQIDPSTLVKVHKNSFKTLRAGAISI